MRLTSLNIQVAIIKAFYALAKKSVKYYTGLAFGKNNTCLFKEIRLLRAYIEILRNFEIVGSTITCSCCVEGDYDVILNTDLPSTVANIQFGCDNQGYMVFNNIGYSFTYWYDNNNNRIVIQFISDLPNPNLIANPNFVNTLDPWNYYKFEWNGYAGIGSALYIGDMIDGGFLRQSDVLEIGKTYTVSFDILTEYFGGENNNIIKVIAGTQETIIFQRPITSTEIIPVSTTVTCFGNTNFEITAISDVVSNQSTFNMYITNVDVREVLNTTITIEDVVFTEECNIEGSSPSPIEVAVIESITNPPVTVDNIYGTWDGSITIATGGNVAFTFPIPVAIIDDPIAIVQAWAADPQTIDWVLLYNDDHFVLYSPFNNVDYSAYTAYFNQYEGGNDSSTDFDLSVIAPFITVNTPAHADILFQQPTFIASHVADTSITLSSGRRPVYKTTPTPAETTILIPMSQFAVGERATMSIPLYELFNATDPEFYYQEALMFTHSGVYTDIAELIADFNVNNEQGFTASDGGFAPISEVLATASNAANLFNIATTGDLYVARLFNSPSLNIEIGRYIVGDDSPEEIANYLAADIIADNTYSGTVSVTGTVITLTAPVGTGSNWNTYQFTIQRNSTRINSYNFSGGQGAPTTPIHILNVAAPNLYPQTDYNGGVIEIQYPVELFEPDGSQFAGAIDDAGGKSFFTNDYPTPEYIYDGALYDEFFNINDMLASFESENTIGAVPELIGNDGVNYIVKITIPSPPNAAWSYNGTNLNYVFIFPFYSYDNVYINGADITEATYTLTILDEDDDPFLEVINTSNFINYQAIVNSINSDDDFNNNFVASLSGVNIIITTLPSLQGAFFNEYTFQLTLDYTSPQYTTSDFVSTLGTMDNGVDAVSPNITLFNDYTSTPIYTLAQNSYDVDGISGFVDYFNTPPTPYNYTAALNGTVQDYPEILSQSLLNLLSLDNTIPNTTVRVSYAPSIFSSLTLIGQFTPITSGDYTASGLAVGLANAVNANLTWNGSAVAQGSTLRLIAPPGTLGLYNNYISRVSKITPANRASVIVTVTSGSSVGFAFGLRVLGPTTVNFNTIIDNNKSASEIAVLYAAAINSNTGTHGYTATAAVGRTTISIFAPVNTGTTLNGATVQTIIASNGVTIQTIPVPTFSGGTNNAPATIANSIFSGGGLTTYDVVTFTADPAIYTNAYNDSTLTYTNLSAFPVYDYPGIFLGGIDNTAGQITLELLQASTNTTWTLYQDPTAYNYFSFQQWATFISESTSTNLDFSASVVDTNFTIHSPEDSFAYFNVDYNLFLGYNYASPQWLDNTYGQLYTITNGVDPVLTSYEGPFVSGDLGDFINTDPCAPSTVTQTCLTNSQISKVIQHIDKLVK